MTFFEMLKNIYKDQKANRDIGHYRRMEDGEPRILGSIIRHTPIPYITDIEVLGVTPDTDEDVGRVDNIKSVDHDAITFSDIIATDWEKMSDEEVQETLDDIKAKAEEEAQKLEEREFEEDLDLMRKSPIPYF